MVLEALDGLREADERLLSLYEETLQMKDDEINLLRKKLANYRLQITDYARERREMLKYIDEAESVIKTIESYQTSVIMVLRKFLLREHC